VNLGLKSWTAECAVEGDALVAGHVALHIGVAIEQGLRFLGGHVGGDENAAGAVFLAPGEQQSARLDLGREEFQVRRPSLLDDVGRLQVGRPQDVEHDSDPSGWPEELRGICHTTDTRDPCC
jgi:hypothetical protein